MPVYNEEANIRRAYEAVEKVFASMEGYDHEYVFADNHSDDGTFSVLTELAKGDERVKVIRYNRNYGFQRSLLTAYRYASGDAAIQIDCDLQDPPELIVEFIRKWEEGYQVVYGERLQRQEAWHMNVIRKFFYRLIDFLSEDKLPFDAGDFRLVDRRVLDVLQQIDDCQPYLRGLIATMGFNQTGIPYVRNERRSGESKFSMAQLFGLALDGILNHSVMPLRLATGIGLIVSVTTFL